MDLDYEMFNSYLKGNREESNVFARFYDKWIKTAEVQENGMPKYVQRLYVEIKVKGNPDIVDKLANERDFIRFPREYAIYKNKAEKIKEGTPLNQFAFLDVRQIDMCDRYGIWTVEALAGLSDEQAKEINLTDEKAKAISFMEFAKHNDVIAEYEEKIKKLNAKIAKLEDENKALKAKNKEE